MAADLAASNPITEAQYKNIQPRLAPQDEGLRRIIAEAMEALDPTLFVESLYLYKKPSKASPEAWTEAERTALYNAALSLSSLAGIQYYSVSHRGMRTFYEISTVVDGPNTKRPLPDPRYSVPPAELTLYARQKDLTFGDNVYKYTYHAHPGSFVFVQENLTAMYLGPIAVVKKNRLRSAVAVLDAGDSLLVYMVSMAKAASFPGLNERAGQSFANRATAILSWFADRAAGVF
jgi:hypothetical protein